MHTITMKNVFSLEVKEELINRINQLSEKSVAQWGSMEAGQNRLPDSRCGNAATVSDRVDA